MGPGTYERNDGIGKSGKGLGFGKPRAEKTVVDNRDYGYEGQKTYTQTRKKSTSAMISKKSTSRSDLVRGSDSVGPGTYQAHKEFGKDLKGLGFGKPKPEKIVVDNRDYGYSQTAEFTQTRHKSPSATITKTGKRPDSFAIKGDHAGPGTYQT